MTSPNRLLIAMACFALVGAPVVAQPPKPRLPDGPPLAGVVEGIKDKIRHDILSSVAAYPDDVLTLMFEAARHPDNLVAMKPEPGDPDFNAAASELYREHPEVFAVLRGHPLSTALLGKIAAEATDGVWSDIDKIRKQSDLVPKAITSWQEPPAVPVPAASAAGGIAASATSSNPAAAAAGTSPVKVDTSSLEKSLGETTKSLEETNEQIEESNKNISDLNTNIDETQAKADELKGYATNPGSSKEATTTAAAAALASGGGKSPGASEGAGVAPFGVAAAGGGVSGFKTGRSKTASASPQAFTSKSMTKPQLQAQMGRGNTSMKTGFASSERSLGGPGGATRRSAGPASGGGRPGPGGRH